MLNEIYGDRLVWFDFNHTVKENDQLNVTWTRTLGNSKQIANLGFLVTEPGKALGIDILGNIIWALQKGGAILETATGDWLCSMDVHDRVFPRKLRWRTGDDTLLMRTILIAIVNEVQDALDE